VPKYVEAYNHWLLTGEAKQLLGRLQWHWGLRLEDDYLDRCVQCRACEKACTQKLPICERLEAIRAEIATQLAQKRKT